jgi:HEAT repeat protein
MKIRQEPADSLLPALENPRSTNWGRAAFTVQHLGTNGQAAVALLVRALEDTNAGIRQQAAMSLGGIASQPALAVPALLNHLQDPNPGMRRAAIDALVDFPSEKDRIVPALLAAMRDPNNNEFLGATWGLERLLSAEEKKTIYVPALIESLDSPVEIVRLNAALFLKRVDPAAAAAHLLQTNMSGR